MSDNLAASGASPKVVVRRSARRWRTISARWDGADILVMIPAGLSKAEEKEHVDALVARLLKRRRRHVGDEDLTARARVVARRFLDAQVEASSVRWVSNQRTRWASVTLATREIRITDRLQGAPAWVIDQVLLHELAHLIEPGHGPAFQALVERDPRRAECDAFLAGMTFAAQGEAVSGWEGDAAVVEGE